MVKASNLKNSIKIFALAATLIVGGCAVPTGNNIFSDAPDKDYSNMYLRGVFNWWEVNEDFRLEQVSSDRYYVDVELIADGQPYDFKVADSTWSPLYNCGLADQSKVIQLESSEELYCYSDSLNLQFIPSVTAFYRFTLDVSDQSFPTLEITKL